MAKGISVLNPVDIERDYLNYTVEYAIKNGYDHFQFIGPIHDGVKGNIDGMTFSKKYSVFNGERDAEYVKYCMNVVNEALLKLHSAGIKSYMWHHELDLPSDFEKEFPEALNSYGDIEVTHPRVKDYLENRIKDFFDSYPNMDGIILTLHETKVPLLKLKNQKLDKIGRVKYVTEILYNTCRMLGKELVVRPFASLEEDYEMMMKAYEEISHDLIVMDKWTQFDWSLTLPHNKFFKKIKHNPILVETDIFGEYFGKGRLPLMLKDHIKEKVEYCNGFSPLGYVSRIDRNGRHPFGDVNEVNLNIMYACLNGMDVDKEIDAFFADKYGEYGKNVRFIMEDTESVLRRIIYLNGYYFSQLSLFPLLNHSKNHFYFEMMRDEYDIASDEWFIPIGWERGSIEGVFAEKESAREDASRLLKLCEELKGKVSGEEYRKLWVKFRNLDLVAKIWVELVYIFYSYTKYFEKKDEKYRKEFAMHIDNILKLNEAGKEELGNMFYCVGEGSFVGGGRYEYVEVFVKEILESFDAEYRTAAELDGEELFDYVLCGGALEGHRLQKEVNFSDTLIVDGELCRIPGNSKGLKWSTIKAHGWFSYEIKVRPEKENSIILTLGSYTDEINLKVTVGKETFEIHEKSRDKKVITIPYKASGDEDRVRIRFDRISGTTPLVYSIKVK